MTTVLFADRDDSSLGPLAGRIVPALLPLQAVPCLERTILALVAGGIRSVLLVTGPRATEIEKRFGKGIRWGIALEYVRRTDEESMTDVLRRITPRLDGDTVVVRGDLGVHPAVGEFLQKVDDRPEPVVAATKNGHLAGLWRIKPEALATLELPREPMAPDWILGAGHAALPLEKELVLVDSIASYRAADRSEKPALSDRAEWDGTAKLLPGTTVAEEACVLAGATLAETSVLPRTVIPPKVSLSGQIVLGNLVVEPDGSLTHLSDRLPPKGAVSRAGFGSRLMGAVALVFSVPLWPIALGWSAVANNGKPTRPVSLSGNAPGGGRAPFQTFAFESAVPVFRDLPLLLAVVTGELALTGVTALPPAEESSLTEPWEKVRLEAPAALLSLARMVVPPGAHPEVARLVDSFQARQGSPGLLALAWKTLFSAKAWTAPKAFNPDVPPENVS